MFLGKIMLTIIVVNLQLQNRKKHLQPIYLNSSCSILNNRYANNLNKLESGMLFIFIYIFKYVHLYSEKTHKTKFIDQSNIANIYNF